MPSEKSDNNEGFLSLDVSVGDARQSQASLFSRCDRGGMKMPAMFNDLSTSDANI
jgi:hypothetical protein